LNRNVSCAALGIPRGCFERYCSQGLQLGNPNKVLIYNDGRLPENWTVDDLLSPHTSKPYNPLIASAFFRSGQIEAWGCGIEKITDACKEWNMPEPFFRVRPNEVMIGFNIESQFGENQSQEKILSIMCRTPKVSAKAIADEISLIARE
jgi:ATP-dependent DNA helicase RecG